MILTMVRNYKQSCANCGRETRASRSYGLLKPFDWCSYCLKEDGFYARKGKPKTITAEQKYNLGLGIN